MFPVPSRSAKCLLSGSAEMLAQPVFQREKKKKKGKRPKKPKPTSKEELQKRAKGLKSFEMPHKVLPQF